MEKKLAGCIITGTVVLGISIGASLLCLNPRPVIAQELSEQELQAEQPYDKLSETRAEEQEVTLNGFVETETGTRYYRNNEYVKDAEVAFGPSEVYAFDGNGYIRTGWYCDENGFHFYRPNGVEKRGWVYDSRNWYYLSETGLYTGWHLIADRMESDNIYWYCFDEGGRLYENTITPDGHIVDYDGKLLKEVTWEKETERETTRTKTTRSKGKSAKGVLSGIRVAGMPAEFYMLSIAGETSGLKNIDAISQGDRGRAYGVCQFDYRYDLVGFMKYAYETNPELWSGFKDYLNVNNGNPILVYNDTIGNTFIRSMRDDYKESLTNQLEYFRRLYWDEFEKQMEESGFDLNNRHIAVSAALFSVNVNCGAQANIFVNNLDPSMSDEEMIRAIYKLRNTVFAEQNASGHRKGTSTRYQTAEPELALDLLYGDVTLDSELNYGGGVEWGGNPFIF